MVGVSSDLPTMKLSRRTWLIALAGLAGVACLPGCERRPTFLNTDITGADYGRVLALTDHTGKRRTLDDFRGKVIVLFFGYTQCPDVCPTTMVEMREVMAMLGPDADRIQVLFVSIDPARDTTELLSQYVPAFDPRFLGLRGTDAETAEAAREFKIFYKKVEGSEPEHYTMDHSAGMYVLDTAGRMRLFVRYGQKPEPIVADLKTLLAS